MKPMPRSPARSPSRLSPVLLLGAGTGEATCGILYLASYLRRHDIEAYVRLVDDDASPDDVAQSLELLLAHLRPRLVGISLKWFHHLARARLIAQAVRTLDPSVRIVVGGNTASYFWKELLAWPCVDQVVLGDGELPLRALARGEPSPPNVVGKEGLGLALRPALNYVQDTANSEDVFYSHFDDIFLSQLDQRSFSGWVAPGRGCGENCLYCGGTRGMQKASFGRAKAFVRTVPSVQKDHREIAPRTWQLRYDFSGSTAEFLERAWEGVDLSRHATTYFLWGVPAPGLTQALSRAFERVFMVLDIGCFSQTQRLETMQRGLLKPCPTDAELLKVIEACARHPNLELEISGIAGLPFATPETLAEERRWVGRLLELGCTIGYQRLESQPGALVTEHPGEFGMVSEARTFQEFLDFFAAQEPGDASVPMVRYHEPSFEQAVERTAREVDAAVWEKAAARNQVAFSGDTRLVKTCPWTADVKLGDWLGAYRVPARFRKTPLTVVRSMTGAGLALAPMLAPNAFADPRLQQGELGATFQAVLAAFEKPTAVDAALRKAPGGRELLPDLVAARFLQPV